MFFKLDLGQGRLREVNHRKSKAMLFNTSRKHDFTPSLSMNNELFEVVEDSV